MGKDQVTSAEASVKMIVAAWQNVMKEVSLNVVSIHIYIEIYYIELCALYSERKIEGSIYHWSISS